MSSFRERPLTWLFLIATALLDIVGAVAGPDSNWLESIIVGQLLIAGCWPALGRTHRLTSAALWVVAVLTITYYSRMIALARLEWRYVLGTVILMSVAALVLTCFWRIVLGAVSAAPSRPSFRFPIIEFFGWTIIVAAAAIGFREAVLEHLQNPQNFWPLVAVAGVVALWMAIFLCPTRLNNLVAALIVAGLGGLVFLAGMYPPLGLIKEGDTAIGILLYVGSFIAVLRMDKSGQRTSPIT